MPHTDTTECTHPWDAIDAMIDAGMDWETATVEAINAAIIITL